MKLKIGTDSSRSLQGFTLVELLVVVGIIAVLVGILLPVMSKARMAGQQAACGSNLRQLAIAMQAYAADNKGLRTPNGGIFTEGVIDGHSGTGSQSWQALSITSGGVTRYDPAQGFLGRYLKTLAVYECPTVKMLDLRVSGGYPSSYGIATLGAQKLSQIREPSNTAMFADTATVSAAFGSFGLFRGGDFGSPQNSAFGSNQAGNFHGRHAAKQGNIVFIDGHVEGIPVQVKPANVWSPVRNENEPVIRFAIASNVGIAYPMKIDWEPVTSSSMTFVNYCTDKLNYYWWLNKQKKSTSYTDN